MNELEKLEQFLTFMLRESPTEGEKFFAREPHPTHVREAKQLVKSCYTFAELAKKYDVESVLLAAARLSVTAMASHQDKAADTSDYSLSKERFIAP